MLVLACPKSSIRFFCHGILQKNPKELSSSPVLTFSVSSFSCFLSYFILFFCQQHLQGSLVSRESIALDGELNVGPLIKWIECSSEHVSATARFSFQSKSHGFLGLMICFPDFLSPPPSFSHRVWCLVGIQDVCD